MPTIAEIIGARIGKNKGPHPKKYKSKVWSSAKKTEQRKLASTKKNNPDTTKNQNKCNKQKRAKNRRKDNSIMLVDYSNGHKLTPRERLGAKHYVLKKASKSKKTGKGSKVSKQSFMDTKKGGRNRVKIIRTPMGGQSGWKRR